MPGRVLPKDENGRPRRCPTCGGRPSHGRPGRPSKNAPCPNRVKPRARAQHQGAFGGRHPGAIEDCASRYCREAVAGGRLPTTAIPELVCRASSIRLPTSILAPDVTRSRRFTHSTFVPEVA